MAVVAINAIGWGVWWQLAQAAPKQAAVQDLTFTLRTDKIEYAPGETIRVTTNLTNLGPFTVTIEQGELCGQGVMFSDEHGTLWFDSRFERACLQIIRKVPIESGHSLVRMFDWEQVDFSGARVPVDHAYRAESTGVVVQTPDGQNYGPLSDETWFFVRADNGP